MITAIDLFSGAGGMSLGASMAGIKTSLAIEVDKYAAETYRFNHLDTKMINDDIRSIEANVFNISGEKKLLFGGPPCQGFSTSNQKTRNSNNEKNWLFLEFLRVTKIWEPDWVVLENVHGLKETEKGSFLDEIINRFAQMGYTCSWWKLNANDFGVPQRRRRLFIIGSRQGIQISPPSMEDKVNVTVQDAIADLPVLENGARTPWLPYRDYPPSTYAIKMRKNLKESPNHLVTRNSEMVIKRYKYIPQGGNWENIPDYLMQNYKDHSRCHTGIYHRLRADHPSIVIGNYRKNMLIHPEQDRGLSVREAARIQSFPDDFEFKGSIGYQQQQVGNAVPPLLAKHVFEKIKSYFDN